MIIDVIPLSQIMLSIGYPPVGQVRDIRSPATAVILGIDLTLGFPYILILALCLIVDTSLAALHVYNPPSVYKHILTNKKVSLL
jgi:hypothetical protein